VPRVQTHGKLRIYSLYVYAATDKQYYRVILTDNWNGMKVISEYIVTISIHLEGRGGSLKGYADGDMVCSVHIPDSTVVYVIVRLVFLIFTRSL